MEGLASTELNREKEVRDLIKKAGLNPNLIHKDILSRLKTLHEGSETFKDELRAIELAKMFFEHYKKKDGAKAFSAEEQNVVLAGTLFSDIGKTGPSDASPLLSKKVLSMYKIDAHFNTNIVDIKTFLEMFFDEKEQEEYLKTLEANGINGDMPMREFFNKHSEWGLKILKKNEGQGIPSDAIIAAASHHMLEGMNPVNITKLSRGAKMVILLDKYDARLRRGAVKHEEAIDWLKNYVMERSSEEDKAEFLELLENMDESLKDNNLYEGVEISQNGEYHTPQTKLQ